MQTREIKLRGLRNALRKESKFLQLRNKEADSRFGHFSERRSLQG